MIRLFLLLPALCLLAWLALIFESEGLALLCFAAVLFAVLSFAYLLYAKRKIHLEIDVPVRMTEKGQSFGIRLETENKSFLKLEKLTVTISCKRKGASLGKDHKVSLKAVPKGKSVQTIKLSIAETGYYIFSIKRVRLYDPFGWFYLGVKQTAKTEMMIMPRIEEVPVYLGEGVKRFYGESVVYDDVRAGDDPGEIFDVREFRDGDKLQRVHWKLSARMDDLVVKENALPKACAIVLFMPEGKSGAGESMDYVASLSFTLMALHCAHYVVWQSAGRNDLLRARVDDEESYFMAMTFWLQDSAAPQEEDPTFRYKEKYKGEPYLHSVRISTDNKVFVDDQDPIDVIQGKNEVFLR